MVKMIELAEQCEKATEPDRELDILVWATVNDLSVIWDGNSLYATTNMLLGWIDPGEHSRNFTPLGGAESRPLYTASLDAAMTLVPDKDIWDVTSTGTAWVQSDYDGTQSFGNAETAALALCAAALKARSHNTPDSLMRSEK